MSVRRSQPSRLGSSAVAFVLVLCVPYIAAASPLPDSQASTSMSAISRYTSDAVGSIRRLSSRLIVLRETDLLDPSTIAHPRLGLAQYDVTTGLFRVPRDYVQLRQTFNPGFIVLSYVIAFIGSVCTLELLVRRTTNNGWRNQLLLLSAGMTFGAVSTFSMHFIFNNSLSLHHPLQAEQGYPALFLSYNPGYTILSLIASCTAMTLAFFVMGTDWHDWWCLPGMRKGASGRRRSSDRGRQNDEYGKWKSAHNKVIRRGTMGVGALLQSASGVAKWSLMDTGDEEERANTGWKSKLAQGKAEGFKKDKKLEELDFRLGPSAVLVELERRNNHSQSLMEIPSTKVIPLHQKPSHLTIQPPLPVFYPPSSRRSSIPEQPSSATSEVFTPGYSFPRIDPDASSSTARLIPDYASNDASWSTPGSRSSYDPYSPIALPDKSARRASLPLAVHRPEPSNPTSRRGVTLTRIQSLPEADQDMQQPSRSASYDRTLDSLGQQEESPTIKPDVLAPAYTIEDVDQEKASKKRVTIMAKPQFTAIEKFLGFDVVTGGEIVKIFITGTIAGFGVASMHYIGQLSIAGMPYIAYKAPYVVGSIIIAAGAVIVALYIMFIMLRPKLKHTWASKLAVAVILAIAVCAMHFCGMMGTIYAWPRGKGIDSHDMMVGTNKAITGIVAALAFLACVACGVFFLLHSVKVRRERARRRRVVVAAVFLDTHDRILVNSSDGMLPMCDIGSLIGSGMVSSSKKSVISGSMGSGSTVLGMDLTTGHDAFVSALRMSWSWRQPTITTGGTLETINPDSRSSGGGQTTLATTLAEIRRGSTMTVESTMTGSRHGRMSVTKFLERFAISSGQLASMLVGQEDGITRLGVLYDQILTTGWVKLSGSNDTVSKGQLIFLVRRVTSSAEKTDLLSRHYIFADPQAVATTLHKTLSVPLDHTMPLLDDIRAFCDSTMRSTLKAGQLYAGLAVVQATPFDGLRILLEQDNRAQLPMREICPIGVDTQGGELGGTVEELGEAITWLEGMSLLSIITRNMTNSNDQLGGPRVAALLSALERALVPMLDEMLTSEDMAHILPRLHLHPVLVPLTPAPSRRSKSSVYTPPYVIVFYANYDAAVNTFTDKWLPFSLFRAQNSCVMAGKVAAAEKLCGIGNVTGISEDVYNYGRRPSKVQFEFPSATTSGNVGTTIPIEAVDGHDKPPVPAPVFGGYSFPPKEKEKDGSIGRISALKAQTRRSSLAKTKFEDKDPGMVIGREKEKEQEVMGVATWDPDWLIALLRTNLRADA